MLVHGFHKLRILDVVIHFAQEFTDRFHVVVVQIRFGDLRGIMSSEHLHLDHIAVVLSRAKLSTAQITRNV